MVAALEAGIDDLLAALRHAERLHRARARTAWPPRSIWPAPSCAGPSAWPWPSPSRARSCVAYLNRLSDLLWAMARWQEGPEHVLSKD